MLAHQFHIPVIAAAGNKCATKSKQRYRPARNCIAKGLVNIHVKFLRVAIGSYSAAKLNGFHGYRIENWRYIAAIGTLLRIILKRATTKQNGNEQKGKNSFHSSF